MESCKAPVLMGNVCSNENRTTMIDTSQCFRNGMDQIVMVSAIPMQSVPERRDQYYCNSRTDIRNG